jgi:hypothetical protein
LWQLVARLEAKHQVFPCLCVMQEPEQTFTLALSLTKHRRKKVIWRLLTDTRNPVGSCFQLLDSAVVSVVWVFYRAQLRLSFACQREAYHYLDSWQVWLFFISSYLLESYVLRYWTTFLGHKFLCLKPFFYKYIMYLHRYSSCKKEFLAARVKFSVDVTCSIFHDSKEFWVMSVWIREAA